MKNLKTLLAVVSLGIAASPALAHHNANAAYNTAVQVQRTGPLIELRDIEPHAVWKFAVVDTQTKAQTVWTLEGVNSSELHRMGLLIRQDLKPGSSMTYIFSPSRDGSNTGLLKAVIIGSKTYRLATY